MLWISAIISSFGPLSHLNPLEAAFHISTAHNEIWFFVLCFYLLSSLLLSVNLKLCPNCILLDFIVFFVSFCFLFIYPSFLVFFVLRYIGGQCILTGKATTRVLKLTVPITMNELALPLHLKLYFYHRLLLASTHCHINLLYVNSKGLGHSICFMFF